jgi:hypothetical protein
MATKFYNELWEAEKRSMAFTHSLWKQRDDAHEFIIKLASGGDETARKAREWLRDMGREGKIQPWLIDLVEAG